MNKDDQDWLDALAGRPDAAADPDTMRRAALLRQAMRGQREAELADASPAPGSHDGGLDRLLFRLRREGLLEKEKAGPRRGFPAMFAMAATVLLVMGLGWMMMFGNDRSAQVAVNAVPKQAPEQAPEQAVATPGIAITQILPAEAPEELAAKLQQEFSSAGIALAQSASGVDIRLEADLPPTPSADALRLFERYNLTIPADRKLHIEIRQQAGQQ
jgi:hypothetical protein